MKYFVKRSIASILAALMVVTSVPAASLAAYAEEVPVAEAIETVEESVVTTTEEVVTEENTSVEAAEVTTEEETSVVEETTTEATVEETSEIELEEADMKIKLVIEDEYELVSDIELLGGEWDESKEYFSLYSDMDIAVKVTEKATDSEYILDKIQYKIGAGSYSDLLTGAAYYYPTVPRSALKDGDVLTICVCAREKAPSYTVAVTSDEFIGSLYYCTSKGVTPTSAELSQVKSVAPVETTEDHNTFEIKVEQGYYLSLLNMPNVEVKKNGRMITPTNVGGYSLGKIISDSNDTVIKSIIRDVVLFEKNDNITASFKSGYALVREGKYTYNCVNADKDLDVSIVPKTGYSVKKVVATPYASELAFENGEEPLGEEIELVAFSDSTHVNWYKLSSDKLSKVMKVKDSNGFRRTCCFIISAETEAKEYTVTLPSDDKVATYEVVPNEDGTVNFKDDSIVSFAAYHDNTVYFWVDVRDSVHNILGTVSKASGTATLTKLTAKDGRVYYKLAGIKSDVTIKATTTLTKAKGGARFILDNKSTVGNVKVTSVKNATYDRANDEYKVNANVAEILVTLTADAPVVPSLGGAEVAPKPAGAAYSYTFSIPAVDINNTNHGETVDIAVYDITSEAKAVDLTAVMDSETTELVSIAEGSTGLYTATDKWAVPFGTTITVVVSAKDNCKLTAAYVNDKKVAFAKNEKITFKVTDLEADTFKIDSQKLLKTIVESNDAAITGKGTTYNILKQYSAAVYVQEGADGKLDLDDENVAITAKIGKDDVAYTVEEDKIVFAEATLDEVAGKTITVTIKDGKKIVSTTKLVISAKCTSVKVQGEKKVDGVDTVYIEMAAKNNPVLKITYNAGVNPADMVLAYAGANSTKGSLDISDGKIDVKYMDMISSEDRSLKKEIEVRFVDRSQGDKVVATKNFVFTTKGFENAAPTVKAVSSSDTEVVLSIAEPKVLGTEMSCIYNITATQVVAKGKLPVEGMYGDDVADSEVVFNNVKPDENGKVTLKLTDSPAGSGKACNYSFTVSGTYYVPSNVNCKPVTVKAATKAPKYETALKLVNKKVKFYADEGEVLVGTAKFSTATTHKEDLKATFFIYEDDKRYPLADNGDIGHVRIDDDYNIYVNVTQYGELTFEIPAGTYYLEIEAAKDPNAEKASTAKTAITILQPIKEITAKYVSSETLTSYNQTPVYRYEPGKALTIPAPTVSYVGDSVRNVVPTTKKVQWSIEDYTPDCGINIDANTGKITIAKDISFEGSFTLCVKAKAADFEKNGTSTTCVLVILPKVDFEVEVMEQSPYEGRPDITREPDMYEEVKLFTSYTDKRIEVKNPVAGATYTYSSSNSEVIEIAPDGHFTFKNDPSASTLGAMITITQKKGTVTKKSRVYVYYENSED
ncbi:MAG: hypothetical protein KBS96_04555 [Lachnospiraceae bacterium]|nr:hypothetical protein [Candidatus Colinaster scatohippi]